MQASIWKCGSLSVDFSDDDMDSVTQSLQSGPNAGTLPPEME